MSEESENLKRNNILMKIRSNYVLKDIFFSLNEKKLLKIILYNKNLLKRLDKNINDYKNQYLKIELEIIPKEYIDTSGHCKIINFIENKESSFHVYFDDKKEEVKRNYITRDENITKIKVIIDSNVKSMHELFKDCTYIKKIDFLKFNRTDIKDMSGMFSKCRYLEEVNFISFNTDNVIKMKKMFYWCECLKK